MKYVTTKDLREWAKSRDCQETLPHLVRRLIRSTATSIQCIKFPSGDNIHIGGWDGRLQVSTGTEYIPEGVSCWEFGCDAGAKGKADSEYEKRSKNPLGVIPSKCTFVFVTPRLWTKGEKWAKARREEKIWKNVIVINAEMLEEWLEEAPAVASWLASFHLNKLPKSGIQSTEDFWKEWSAGTKVNFIPEVVLVGREREKKLISESHNTKDIVVIQAPTKQEALAFIITSFLGTSQEEDFTSRSLIVDDPETFRRLASSKEPLILIPRFEDRGMLNRASSQGHKIYLPLDPDSSSNLSGKIVLPKLDRGGFIKSMEKLGFSNEEAEKLSKESARNLTILRRQLGFDRSIPNWASRENVAELLPALLVGRWDGRNKNDQKILAQLADESYEQYVKRLSKWLHAPDSPIQRIGNEWRLKSPLDSWAHASKYLVETDFKKLADSLLEIMNEINPKYDLDPKKMPFASLFGKNLKFSQFIRKGILQSMVLVSLFGEKLNFDLPYPASDWVDIVMRDLLENPDPLFWKSIGYDLRLIAEASPNSFLNAIEGHLKSEESPIAALFDGEKDIIFSQSSSHTGLLWALESLAWQPGYLAQIALILAKLTKIDPGGQLLNRPVNSLISLFRPWFPQTLASLEERLDVLKLILKRNQIVATKLLIHLIPDGHDMAMSNNKPRWKWRDSLSLEAPKINQKELSHALISILDIVVSEINQFNEAQIAKLITSSQKMDVINREKILSTIEQSCTRFTGADEPHFLWNTIRKLLAHHRAYPAAKWALAEVELEKYQLLYDKLKPNDLRTSLKWIFTCRNIELLERHNLKGMSHVERQELVNSKRDKALQTILENHSMDEVIKMGSSLEDAWAFGFSLGRLLDEKEDIYTICELLHELPKNERFIHSFFAVKSISKDQSWFSKLCNELLEKEFSSVSVAQILGPINQSRQLWEMISNNLTAGVEKEYWIKMSPRFFHLPQDEIILGINHLLDHQRLFSAMDAVSLVKEQLPANLIVEVLTKAATEESIDSIHIDDYVIESIFKELYNRTDIDKTTLIRLEWFYVFPLTSLVKRNFLKCTHKEIKEYPSFFVELLIYAFTSEDETIKGPESQVNLSVEQKELMARKALRILFSIYQVPGMNTTDDEIDYEYLKNWIVEVRELSGKIGRLKVADRYIAQILAEIPMKADRLLPPNEICELIEFVQSDVLNRNYSSSLFNKQGVTSRGVFDGGIKEHNKAELYMEASKAIRNQYPEVSKILNDVASSYLNSATRLDLKAERDGLDF